MVLDLFKVNIKCRRQEHTLDDLHLATEGKGYQGGPRNGLCNGTIIDNARVTFLLNC